MTALSLEAWQLSRLVKYAQGSVVVVVVVVKVVEEEEAVVVM